MAKGKLFSVLISTVTSLIVLMGALSPVTTAASSVSSGGNGLKVSPVVSNLVIKKGETQTIPVYIQNVTQTSVTLQVFVNDFIPSGDESGKPALLLDPDQYAPSHSLKRLVAPMPNITLAAGERKSVSVIITVPKGAAAGGYYGAVRFAPASTTGSKSITLTANVASLVLVRVPGDIKENLVLTSFDVRQGTGGSPNVIFTSNNDLLATVRIENRGDVQEQPFGKVLLKQNGKQLATYELNDTSPRGNVLPGSIRKFTINLDKVGLFGQYTVVGNFSYDQSGQLLSGSTTFYVVPLAAILGVLGVALVVLFFIFVAPRLLRSYNRRIIAGARRR